MNRGLTIDGVRIPGKVVQQYESTLLSPEWRVDNLYTIRDKRKVEIPFRRNAAQQLIDQSIKEQIKEQGRVRQLYLKCRQIGCTSGLCIRNLDLANHNKNQFAAIMAHRSKEVGLIFRDYIKYPYDMLDGAVRTRAKYDTKTSLELRNGSKIVVSMDGQGTTTNIFHVSEASQIEDAEGKITKALQAVPKDGDVFIESVGNGPGGYFYNLVMEALEGNKAWKFLFLLWTLESDYSLPVPRDFVFTDEHRELQAKHGLTDGQIVWRDWKITELGGDRVNIETGLTGYQLFFQFYPLTVHQAFVSGSGLIFDNEKLDAMLADVKRPRELPVGMGIFRQYRSRRSGWQYLIGADTSEGTGQDYSAAVVLGCPLHPEEEGDEEPKFCGVINGKFSPADFARVLVKLSEHYNDAMLVIERNNHGHAVILECEHINSGIEFYYHRDYDSHGKEKPRAGFPTTGKTRSIALSLLQESIVENFIIPDERSLSECLTFRYYKGKAQALAGCNDDIVIAMAIALYGWREEMERAPIWSLPKRKPHGL